MRGAEGKKIDVEFTKGNIIGVWGPAVSTDRGHSWNWLGAEPVEGSLFHYRVPSGLAEVRFSVTIPYFESDLHAFLARHLGDPALEPGVLARSQKGRAIA